MEKSLSKISFNFSNTINGFGLVGGLTKGDIVGIGEVDGLVVGFGEEEVFWELAVPSMEFELLSAEIEVAVKLPFVATVPLTVTFCPREGGDSLFEL